MKNHEFDDKEVSINALFKCGKSAWEKKRPSKNEQSIRNVFERFAKTSLEIFKDVGFKYGNAWILDNDYAKIWLAANKLIGSCWEWSQEGSLPESNPFIKEPVDNRVKRVPKAVVKIKSTAIGALPLCKEPIDDQETFIDLEKEVCALAPRKYATYVQIV